MDFNHHRKPLLVGENASQAAEMIQKMPKTSQTSAWSKRKS